MANNVFWPISPVETSVDQRLLRFAWGASMKLLVCNLNLDSVVVFPLMSVRRDSNHPKCLLWSKDIRHCSRFQNDRPFAQGHYFLIGSRQQLEGGSYAPGRISSFFGEEIHLCTKKRCKEHIVWNDCKKKTTVTFIDGNANLKAKSSGICCCLPPRLCYFLNNVLTPIPWVARRHPKNLHHECNALETIQLSIFWAHLKFFKDPHSLSSLSSTSWDS